MSIAKMTSKGQITLPISIRNELGLTSGIIIDFSVGDRGIIIARPKTRPITDLRGAAKRYITPGHSVSLEEMDDAIANAIWEKAKPNAGY